MFDKVDLTICDATLNKPRKKSPWLTATALVQAFSHGIDK